MVGWGGHPVAALQVRRRRAAGSNATRPLLGMMLENCHDDDGMSLGPEGRGGNAPYYRSDGELWCPFHTYRTSGDARPTYGSLMANLNSTRAMAARNLSVPGCVSCRPHRSTPLVMIVNLDSLALSPSLLCISHGAACAAVGV
eukprot:COSAG01_NODE_2227_length_8132_cov_3.231420_6_plen_143_part_00